MALCQAMVAEGSPRTFVWQCLTAPYAHILLNHMPHILNLLKQRHLRVTCSTPEAGGGSWYVLVQLRSFAPLPKQLCQWPYASNTATPKKGHF